MTYPYKLEDKVVQRINILRDKKKEDFLNMRLLLSASHELNMSFLYLFPFCEKAFVDRASAVYPLEGICSQKSKWMSRLLA